MNQISNLRRKLNPDSQRPKQHGIQKQVVIKYGDGKVVHSQKSSNRIKPDPGMTSSSIRAAVKKNNYLLESGVVHLHKICVCSHLEPCPSRAGIM